ncbi:hypothetical protein [uncultured Tateyamaria sp.]|uniref:hypothetical protein n=1 Tax=uncultured Tateyamaria sp. TaxID=455651 RepID=UPI00260850E7|nr:hypothetical protein [uncultured Tateyamaria sp.]
MSVENINLNFINKSADTNNSGIVIYQQNVAVDFDELTVAWRVIQNVGQLDNHRFVYPILFDMSARDSYGSYTPQITADNGNAYEMINDGSGDILRLASNTAASPNEVLAQNNLPQGAIDICIYRDGKLLAQKTGIAPCQKAAFQFQPRLYIGVASGVQEGDVLSSALLSQINGQINLFGISSADIIMTGGGPNGTPFDFHLENIAHD